MIITTKMINELRIKTNVGIMDCKKALMESDGNIDKAINYLRINDILIISNRLVIKEGIIGYYIHTNNKIVAMVKLMCDTDFTAKNEYFQSIANNIAMHIVSENPLYLDKDSIPDEDLNNERNIYKAQALAGGKPIKIIEKIVGGRLHNFYKEKCLLNQKFIKDEKLTINDLLIDLRNKFKEDIFISEFVRLKI